MTEKELDYLSIICVAILFAKSLEAVPEKS